MCRVAGFRIQSGFILYVPYVYPIFRMYRINGAVYLLHATEVWRPPFPSPPNPPSVLLVDPPYSKTVHNATEGVQGAVRL